MINKKMVIDIAKHAHDDLCRLEQHIERRDATFDSRSIYWQESEKGQAWQEDTDSLNLVRDKLSDLFEECMEIVPDEIQKRLDQD